jgi:hypothetical protein
VHAAQHDDVRLRLGGLLGERKRVALHVGDAVEDFRRLVVVGEDDRVPPFLPALDLHDERGVEPPLGRGDDVANGLVADAG